MTAPDPQPPANATPPVERGVFNYQKLLELLEQLERQQERPAA